MKNMRDLVEHYIGTALGIGIVVLIVKWLFLPQWTIREILQMIMRSKIWWFV
jgi:hypothetical protein